MPFSCQKSSCEATTTGPELSVLYKLNNKRWIFRGHIGKSGHGKSNYEGNDFRLFFYPAKLRNRSSTVSMEMGIYKRFCKYCT